MNYDKFYYMFTDHESRKGYLNAEIPTLDYAQARLIGRGETELPASIEARAVGRARFDYLITDKPGLDIYSEQVFQLLERKQFTGWSSIPVTMIGKTEKRIDTHRAMVVTGRSGDIDYKLSQRLEVPGLDLPVGHRKHYNFRGHLFPENTWDGSDIFFPGTACLTYVTEAVRDAFLTEQITGISFVRIDCFEQSDYGQMNG